MNSEEHLFNEAIAKSELMQYLGGFPGYCIQSQFADLPTEYYGAFTPIKSRIKDDSMLQEKVVDAIKSLAQDPEYGWGAIYHIGNLALLKQYQGIDLLSSDLLASVAAGLRRNKAAFTTLKRWEGINHENGVWALVVNKNRNLHNDDNITVLPEEL